MSAVQADVAYCTGGTGNEHGIFAISDSVNVALLDIDNQVNVAALQVNCAGGVFRNHLEDDCLCDCRLTEVVVETLNCDVVACCPADELVRTGTDRVSAVVGTQLGNCLLVQDAHVSGAQLGFEECIRNGCLQYECIVIRCLEAFLVNVGNGDRYSRCVIDTQE